MEAGSIVERPDGALQNDRDRAALRARLHGMWAAVAPSWGEHADVRRRARGAASPRRMLDRSRPRPGRARARARLRPRRRGHGGRGARRPGRRGRAVRRGVRDDRDRRRARRGARARQRQHAATSTSRASISPTARTTSCCAARGSCSRPTLRAAAREIARVLRPGGRAAIAVWGPRERNPWLGLVFDAVSAQIGRARPAARRARRRSRSATSPGSTALLDGRGPLRRARSTELPTPLRAGSFEEWWARTSALAGPLAKILAGLPDEAQERAASPARGARRALRDRRAGSRSRASR